MGPKTIVWAVCLLKCNLGKTVQTAGECMFSYFCSVKAITDGKENPNLEGSTIDRAMWLLLMLCVR
jgi:hypothetical protein